MREKPRLSRRRGIRDASCASRTYRTRGTPTNIPSNSAAPIVRPALVPPKRAPTVPDAARMTIRIVPNHRTLNVSILMTANSEDATRSVLRMTVSRFGSLSR